MKRLIFIIEGVFLSLLSGMSQNISISGIVNHYLQVSTLGSDRVTVVSTTELSYFQPGDKVLLIQMTGTTLPDPPAVLTNSNRFRKAWNHAGAYEILQVYQVAGNEVIFTDDLSNSYDAGEKIQLVRLMEGDIVTVTGTVNAQPWNGNTGGIVAIIGMDSVIMKANIDVSEAGFRGGKVPTDNYTGGCRTDVSAAILDTLYFLPTQTNKSGNKGEGIISTSWPYTMGTGFAVNGGGAGNGLYSGGAGGSNYQAGGDGGRQTTLCAETLRGAWGGYACIDLYRSGRVIMGGGGGSGVKSLTNTATDGGNGGGMVFIITGILDVRNNSSVSANGQSISNSVSGSGGGGGAGGTVVFDVTGYSGSVPVNIKGGQGGKVNGTPCTGSGGGGSGGLFWYSGASLFPLVTVDTIFGSAGYTASCSFTVGSPGGYAGKLNNLLTPLTGFLFNSIRGVDTLCAGQVPNQLTASQPKGGNGIYDFQWEQSTDMVNWNPALGAAALRTLTPPVLSQTTWYRRIVSSDVTYDTSRTIEVYVYPAITNNIISGTDTVCFNLQSKILTGTNPTGGNGVFDYQWQYSTDMLTWIPGGTSNSYNAGKLQQSRFFRRLVSSTAYCSHTSDTVKISVLPSITQNEFVSGDTVICENSSPGLLNAKIPSNGDGTFTYLWEYKTVTGNWTSVPSSNLLRYNPGILADTTLYRRIVFSGNDMACRDTSVIKAVNVLPAIANNLATTDTSRYCAGEIPALVNGAQPSGGDGLYTYQWRIRTSGNWAALTGIGATSMNYTPDQIVETNTQFSRIVTSGLYNACRDTSTAVSLVVVPYINNHLGLSDQTICENVTPLQLSTTPATGGLGGFTYQWIKYENEASGWVNASGTGNLESYTPGVLTVTTLFARKAYSDICTHISDTVTVIVYPAISNNNITGGTVQYACFNSSKSLTGSGPSDGNGSYQYLWEQSSNNTDWIPAAMIPENDPKNLITHLLTTTQYFRRVVFSSPALHECADTSGPVEVRINPLPSGDLIHTVDTLCAGEPLQIKFNTAGIHPPFSVTIDGQTRTGITTSPDSMSFVPLSTHTFTMFSVADDSGCVADPAGYNEQALAVVYDVPDAYAGPDGNICSNTYMLQAEKRINGSAGSWSASGTTFADPADPQSSVTTDQYGMYTFTWTETNWHCADTDQVEVIFYEQPQAPDAGPDQLLDFVYTAQLGAIAPSVGSGKWTVVTGAGIFSNDTLPDAVVSELENSTTLQWTVHNGSCPDVSDKVDLVISPLIIPKGFTPNGDNKNDVFNLGAVNAETIRIKIYNAAGILVFESDDYQNSDSWNGKNMNDVELPEGTYFYIAEIKVAGREKEFQFRSFVEILR